MSTADFRILANSHIQSLTPYQPGKPIEELERELGIASAIKLASNENPLGPSPVAIAAAQQALHNVHIYPDGGCFALKNALAEFWNVEPTQLTIGNGSENILEIIGKAYLGKDDEAVMSQYAFLTIPIVVKSCAAQMITVPAKDFGHDIDQILAAVTTKTRIVFIVNPNNPTGTYSNKQQVQKLLDGLAPSVLVVMDEAYFEFMDKDDYPDTVKLLKQYPNLIISRTFSKAYGLAGLRVGYAISSAAIADMLNRARLPFNINSIAAIAATAALSDQNHVSKTLELNKKGMAQFEQGLNELGLSFIPSCGNFITVNVERAGKEVYQQLLHLGVIVRPLDAYGLSNYLRLSIGTLEQNARLLQAMAQVLGTQ